MTELSVWCAILADCKQCATDFDNYGGFLVYILFTLYSFYILAQICDGHLTRCLEIIVLKLGLSEDVAGATFLAMASSAPELFCSIVSTFVLPSPAGVGNIVGSALFNLLCIIGVLPLVSVTGPLKIWWYPTTRDAGFYVLSILEIFLVIWDGKVVWWEGLIMVLTYGLYILYFYKNQRIMDMLGIWAPQEEVEIEAGMEVSLGRPLGEPQPDLEGPQAKGGGGPQAAVVGAKVEEGFTSEDCNLEEAYAEPAARSPGPSQQVYLKPGPGDDARTANTQDLDPEPAQPTGAEPSSGPVAEAPAPSQRRPSAEPVAEAPAPHRNQSNHGAAVMSLVHSAFDASRDSGRDGEAEGWRFCVEPGMFLVDKSMPNPEKHILAAFAVTTIWIALYTYVMVDNVERLGCVLGVPKVVMGLVVLAAGTSVPDMVASMAVAREGHADMAAANAVGSNTFDILLGLGMPWFVGCLVGKDIDVPTKQISESIYILAGALLTYLVMLHLNGWSLNRKIGAVLVSIYVGSIAFTIARNYTQYKDEATH